MYTRYPKAWKEYVCPDAASLSKFWTEMPATAPYVRGRACLQRPDRNSRCIPMSLHGDGVQVTGLGKTWAKGCDAYSMSSLLSNTGGSGITNALLGLLPSDLLEHPAAVDDFFRRLRWSLNCLAEGTWPRSDHRGVDFPEGSVDRRRAGRPLASGFYAVILCVKGDLDFVSKSLKGPNASSAAPCALCECDMSDRPFWDLSPEAAWRRTTRDLQSPCPLFASDLTLQHLVPDWMHSKHLGTDAYAAGSVLAILTYVKMNLFRNYNSAVSVRFEMHRLF